MYAIRIKGRLGPTALSAFPTMASELNGDETVLTGLLKVGTLDGARLRWVTLRMPMDIEKCGVAERFPGPRVWPLAYPPGLGTGAQVVR